MSAAGAVSDLETQAPNLTPPPGNPRFPLFDALRAIAALSVFAGHTITGVFSFAGHATLFVWAAAVAREGVAIFFLISGFLLYRPFLVARRGGPALRVSAYAKRRFLRIVPGYWAALSICIAAGFVGGVTGHNWWVFYGFGQVYSATLIGRGIGVAWTLCVEVTFYALLPVFVLVASRLSARPRSLRPDVALLAVLGVASLAFRAHYSSFYDAEKVATLAGMFCWFALGMLLAIASVALKDRWPPAPPDRLTRLWPVASWCAAGLLFVLVHEVEIRAIALSPAATSVAINALSGLAALGILLPAVFAEGRRGIVPAFLGSRGLAWIGLVSYGVYLYHTIVIDQLNKLLGGGSLAWRYPVVVLTSLMLTLACAAVSYYVLERPMMLLGRRWGARRGGRWIGDSGVELLGSPGPAAVEQEATGGEQRLQPVHDRLTGRG
jgi:peptidoglycan/LPS O-acetylase OafA/YrhL